MRRIDNIKVKIGLALFAAWSLGVGALIIYMTGVPVILVLKIIGGCAVFTCWLVIAITLMQS